jgi:hypothetical protein
MTLAAILGVGSGIAAVVMSVEVNRREQLARPGRRRWFLGVHELLRPLDQTRYHPEAERHHARAELAFAAMVSLFVAGGVVYVIASLVV